MKVASWAFNSRLFCSSVSLLLTASCPLAARAQNARATVKVDSLQAYSEATTQSDSLSSLVRGTIVQITWTMTNDEGSWCNISRADSSSKLGFVQCEGLVRETPINTASQAPSGAAFLANSPTTRPPGSQPITRAQKSWGLAASAMLTEFNHGEHDTLAGFPMTPAMRRSIARLLADSWGIQNRDDLLSALAWIDQRGHRAEFSFLGEKGSQLQPEQLKTVLAHLDSEDANSLLVARRYYQKLGAKGITGWDYERYINVCRLGYGAGYLSEDEAWQAIMHAAQVLQQNFGSWQELGQNYLIGREFWSLAQTRKDGAQMRAAYTRLLNNPASPWHRVQWNLALE